MNVEQMAKLLSWFLPDQEIKFAIDSGPRFVCLDIKSDQGQPVFYLIEEGK